MEEQKPKGSGMEKIATFIVDKRNLFFLLYAFALIFSIVATGWVKVENDITTYLPEDTETRQGLTVMNDNFVTYGTARVMVSNVTYETAENICSDLESIDGVTSVDFDDTTDHYKSASALFSVTFDGTTTDDISIHALHTIRDMLAGYDTYIDTEVGVDTSADLQSEMSVILVLAAIVIVLVLTLTSRSYAEVPVLIMTFGAAALLNMGTNFLCGTISFISNSVTVILQLALAIDYAIILCHRFTDERETRTARDACITALSKAIPEISASSLTTVSGLAALGFMEFKIGLDMALVLVKAILFSLLSVFTLMPGLLMLFSPLMDRTRHKKLLPNITPIGKFAVKTRRVVPPLFAILLVGAFILSNRCPFVYSYNNIETANMNERQAAYFKIQHTFGTTNMVALVVPSGNYDAEAKILEELDTRPEVKSTMGLANIEAMDGYTLTDSLNPRELSELVGMDYEVAQLLYSAYAIENDQYGEFVQGLDKYDVPLFDMLMFLKDQLDSHNISLDDMDEASLNDIFSQLDMAQKQLKSDRYSRMVVYLNLPEESDETFAFLTEMRNIVGKYYDGDYYVVGNSTSSRDLSSSFVKDNLVISILSSLFVILVLLFTFQSAGLPILLIACILGSVWINFSFPTLANQPLYFLGYLIVQSIQMGANIDYAIVISSHYQELKATMTHKEAIVEALNASFPTILTSGTILSAAALLIGNISTNPVISILGTCLGRGTIISIVIVLGVLPATLVLSDSIINRTSFKMKGIELPTRTASGTMYVSGHLRGQVSGVLDGEFTGTIRGDMHAIVSTSTQVKKLDESEAEGGEDNA